MVQCKTQEILVGTFPQFSINQSTGRLGMFMSYFRIAFKQFSTFHNLFYQKPLKNVLCHILNKEGERHVLCKLVVKASSQMKKQNFY